MNEQPIDAQKLTKEIIEAEVELKAMGNTPKSECKCLDCNLPELETLSYEPVKSSRATEENLTPIIEPETKGKNSEVVSQHFEQSLKQPSPLETVDSFASSGTEQPNTELLIIKTIQGLISAVNRELGTLVAPDKGTEWIISQAIEDIDIFEKTTLYRLQKAFE